MNFWEFMDQNIGALVLIVLIICCTLASIF